MSMVEGPRNCIETVQVSKGDYIIDQVYDKGFLE